MFAICSGISTIKFALKSNKSVDTPRAAAAVAASSPGFGRG
jgi:hypothetical protein